MVIHVGGRGPGHLARVSGSVVPYRLGFLGDSIMQRNHSISSTGGFANTQGVGEVAWAQAYYPHFEFDTWFDDDVPVTDFTGMNGGISGDTSADVLARIVPMRVRRPGVLLLSIGTNDVIQSVSASTAMANITAICEYFRQGGRTKIILATVRPQGVTSIPDADARLTILSDLNTAIRSYAAATHNVTLWDVYDVYDDGSGRPISGYLNDDIHLTRTGAQVGGRSLATVIEQVLGSDYSDIPTGTSLASNPTLTGTTGTEGTRVTGDTATSWRLAASGTGTATGVASKDGNDKQVFTITPQAAGSSSEAFLLSRTSGSATVTPGNWVRCYTRIRLSAWDGWRNVAHQNTLSVGLGTVDAGAVIDAPDEQLLDIIGPPLLIKDGVASLAPVFRIDVDGTASGSGTATIEHFGVYEVPDPRPSH